jgi:hypothetical protein
MQAAHPPVSTPAARAQELWQLSTHVFNNAGLMFDTLCEKHAAKCFAAHAGSLTPTVRSDSMDAHAAFESAGALH